MIYTNALSMFILHHNQNRICKKIRSIQELMCTSKLDNEKLKHVCEDFPNNSILPKSSTPGDIQLTFAHASIGKKFLGCSVTKFALAWSLDSPTVILINSYITFASAGDKIRLPISELLLRAAAVNFTRSTKKRYWDPLNSIFLPPFLTEADILDGKTSAEYVLKIFVWSITKRDTELK